jgi:branched-chain amino acid transport system permease protein
MGRAVALVQRVPSWGWPALGAAVVLLLPQLGLAATDQRQVVLICMLALVVSGLNLSLGFAGELALGQAAIYAAGAYVSGYLGVHGHTDLLVQLTASAVAALFVGLITGIPGLRLGSWSLAMASFFLVLLVPDLIAIFPKQTGGRIGLAGIGYPTLGGVHLTREGYYLAVVVVTVGWLWVLRNLVTSRHGIALQVLRQSPILASSLGISVYRTKLTAYAIAAIPAGLAGSLFANLDHYVSSGSFGFSLAISILAASILGGSVSVYGAVVGATIMQLGPLESTSFQKYALLAYGIFLLLGGVLLAEGLSGISRRLWRRIVRSAERRPAGPVAAPTPPAGRPDPLPGVTLSVQGISKSFGGLEALQDVSVTAQPGRILALIGPNGSGKTTLLNLICGFYRPDAGTVCVGDQPVNGRSPDWIARAGVARTFQTPVVPKGITVSEAVAAGRYATDYTALATAVLRLPSYRRTRGVDDDETRKVLDLVGIGDLAHLEAAALPLGTRRLLEVARALISRPRVVLLDEAASGLDEDEVSRLAELIRAVRDAGATVILVEHNFGLVLSLADDIHVLARGRIIASGPPSIIEHHPVVLSEYLGTTRPVADLAIFEPPTP